MMASHAHLDMLLGQTLECLNEAAGQVRELELEPVKDNLMYIGRAIEEVWGLRERLYAMHPEVKRDFVQESEADPTRFEALTQVLTRASEDEAAGRLDAAADGYRRLLGEAQFGFFRRCAEAGLFRVASTQ
jgi:hypothetical protein